MKKEEDEVRGASQAPQITQEREREVRCEFCRYESWERI